MSNTVFHDGLGEEIKIGHVLADTCGCCVNIESLCVVRGFTDDHVIIAQLQPGDAKSPWKLVENQVLDESKSYLGKYYVVRLMNEGSLKIMINRASEAPQ